MPVFLIFYFFSCTKIYQIHLPKMKYANTKQKD
ncbi:hypothetical protein HZS_2662 [Henneguya salminicola]|nr:hypothetical protein HZS_2662 [Henneguya salminicola]